MELALIGIVALLTAGLTLFSGFGLGTILMPVFARFGIPAAVAAIVGASLLTWFDRMPVIANYTISGSAYEITVVKAVIGVLIVVFGLLELWPRFQALAFPPRWLPLGGILSGFFGGLSGNQGALRSAFLLKAGLSKEAFVATGVVSAVIVDAVRLITYGTGVLAEHLARSQDLLAPVAVATVCAFIGSLAGKRVLQKITLRTVQIIVAVAMLLIGTGLASGLI